MTAHWILDTSASVSVVPWARTENPEKERERERESGVVGLVFDRRG